MLNDFILFPFNSKLKTQNSKLPIDYCQRGDSDLELVRNRAKTSFSEKLRIDAIELDAETRFFNFCATPVDRNARVQANPTSTANPKG
ncbi:MAG: hypothetical protein HC849_26480 [Oscillatoriales cyanobacterium RU_3_3]|nr:hypothetical protein [Oscillatoriales cyanobacterium RU_3_3]NJR22323.1 hypothetical protein [Richelia sp. CSU_2_1]